MLTFAPLAQNAGQFVLLGSLLMFFFQVREINMYKETEQTPYKQKLDPQNLIRCWNECMVKSAYYSRLKAVEEFNRQNYWKKKGIAIIPMKYPFGLGSRYLSQVSFFKLPLKILPRIVSWWLCPWKVWFGLYHKETYTFRSLVENCFFITTIL